MTLRYLSRQPSDMPLSWGNVHRKRSAWTRLPDGAHLPQAERPTDQPDAARGPTHPAQADGPGRGVSKQRLCQGRVDLVCPLGNDLDHGAATGVTLDGYFLAKATSESCLIAVQS